MTARRSISWNIFNTEIRGMFLADDALPIAAQRKALVNAVERSTGHKLETLVSMGSTVLGDRLPDFLHLISTQVQRSLKALQSAPAPPDERSYERALVSVECVEYFPQEPTLYSAKPTLVERQLVVKVVYENERLAVFKLDKARQMNHGFGPTLPQWYCFASFDRTERGDLPVYPYYAEHLEVEKNLVRGWFEPPRKRHSVCWRPVLESECAVCLQRNANWLSSDCKGAHFVGCAECANNLSTCPICRAPLRMGFPAHQFSFSCETTNPKPV